MMMKSAILIHSVLLASTFVMITATVAPSTSPPVPGGCADSVISFSPCLPYISAPPNNLSNDPSSQCCEIFDGSFDSGDAECLCYLVRQTTLLGFPLNATKLLSLSDLCSLNNDTHSLQSICSGAPSLPPLIGTTNKPHPSGSNTLGSPPPPHTPLPYLPPETITIPRPARNASGQNATKPSASSESNNGNQLTRASAVTLMSAYLMWFVQIYYNHFEPVHIRYGTLDQK